MNLCEYKVGDKVDVFLYEKKRSATVTKVSDEGVEVKLDKPIFIKFVEGRDFKAYLDPETYMKRFLIKDKGIMDKL